MLNVLYKLQNTELYISKIYRSIEEHGLPVQHCLVIKKIRHVMPVLHCLVKTILFSG